MIRTFTSLELSSRSRTVLIILLNALMQQDAGESGNLDAC